MGERVEQQKGHRGQLWRQLFGGLGEQQLKVPYISVGNPFGLEEAQAVIEAMQGETLTMGKFVTKFRPSQSTSVSSMPFCDQLRGRGSGG